MLSKYDEWLWMQYKKLLMLCIYIKRPQREQCIGITKIKEYNFTMINVKVDYVNLLINSKSNLKFKEIHYDMIYMWLFLDLNSDFNSIQNTT